MARKEFTALSKDSPFDAKEIEAIIEEIAKMDKRNADRKAKPSKKSAENEPIKARIAEVLSDTPQTASEIASKVEISVQKASALLRQMECKVTEVKVPKKGTQKAYSL